MSEQSHKTKQQLLEELNSIVSMLGEDSTIPTLDAVVEQPAEPKSAEPIAEAEAIESSVQTAAPESSDTDTIAVVVNEDPAEPLEQALARDDKPEHPAAEADIVSPEQTTAPEPANTDTIALVINEDLAEPLEQTLARNDETEHLAAEADTASPEQTTAPDPACADTIALDVNEDLAEPLEQALASNDEPEYLAAEAGPADAAPTTEPGAQTDDNSNPFAKYNAEEEQEAARSAGEYYQLDSSDFDIAIPDIQVPELAVILGQPEPEPEPEPDNDMADLGQIPASQEIDVDQSKQLTLDDALSGELNPESGEFQYSLDVNLQGEYAQASAAQQIYGRALTEPNRANRATAEQAANPEHLQLVDELVAQYLPEIEAQLRQRLLASLENNLDF